MCEIIAMDVNICPDATSFVLYFMFKHIIIGSGLS